MKRFLRKIIRPGRYIILGINKNKSILIFNSELSRTRESVYFSWSFFPVKMQKKESAFDPGVIRFLTEESEPKKSEAVAPVDEELNPRSLKLRTVPHRQPGAREWRDQEIPFQDYRGMADPEQFFHGLPSGQDEEGGHFVRPQLYSFLYEQELVYQETE